MEYRIAELSNGTFKVQYKYRYRPFWFTYSESIGLSGVADFELDIVFETRIGAEKKIKYMKEQDNNIIKYYYQ